MIKGIIFDIDGVLLDSLGIWDDLGARYLLSIGVKPEEGLSEILFSMSMELHILMSTITCKSQTPRSIWGCLRCSRISTSMKCFRSPAQRNF